jgi:hypothetical protein
VTRPEKWNWLHRDADGNALLDGPNCPDCNRVAVARYRCTACDQQFDVPGRFKWSWQGKGHWHEPDDQTWWDTVSSHVAGHNGHAVIVPTDRSDQWWETPGSAPS